MIYELLAMLAWIPFAGLGLTILFEWGVYSAFIRKNFLKLLGYSILINGLTNPLANLVHASRLNFLIIEFLVFFVEIFLIKYLFKINYKNAILISFIANLITGFLSIFMLI